MRIVGVARSYALALTTFILFLGCSTVGAQSNMEGDSLICYQCNSEYDPRCGDPFDPYSLGTVNCSLIEALEHLQGKKPHICRKNIQKVYGKVRVVRGCGYIEDSNLGGKCLYRSGTYNVYSTYCSCKGNLCNASPRVTTATALLVAAITPVLAAHL